MMSDFKTSWITLTSPRAMFTAQVRNPAGYRIEILHIFPSYSH
jgi:hypothetical protein